MSICSGTGKQSIGAYHLERLRTMAERIEDMPNFICVTCGTEYPESEQMPAHCRICEDDRQYVNPNGQAWTTLDELRRQHHNTVESIEPGLHQIKSEPKVGIGQ